MMPLKTLSDFRQSQNPGDIKRALCGGCFNSFYANYCRLKCHFNRIPSEKCLTCGKSEETKKCHLCDFRARDSIKVPEGIVIFDKSGRITLQLPGFAYHYDTSKQAIQGLGLYLLKNGHIERENDEGAAKLDPTYDQIRNCDYYVYSITDVVELATSNELDFWYGDVQEFCKALKIILMEDVR